MNSTMDRNYRPARTATSPAQAIPQPRQRAKATSSAALKPAHRNTVRVAIFTFAVITMLIGAQGMALVEDTVTVQAATTTNTITQVAP